MMTNRALEIESLIAMGRYLSSPEGRLKKIEYFYGILKLREPKTCAICGEEMDTDTWAIKLSVSYRTIRPAPFHTYIHGNQDEETCAEHELAKRFQAAVATAKPRRPKWSK